MVPTSYRFRIPLSLILASVVTVTAFSALILFQTFVNIRDDQRLVGERLVQVLAPTLSEALRHDDVWGAYTLLRGPELQDTDDDGFLILVDDADRVFASNRPARYRVGDPLAPALAERLPAPDPVMDLPPARSLRAGARSVLVADLASDRVHIGRLLVGFPTDAFRTRFLEIAWGGTLALIGILAVLVPAGWVWGNRIVAPLRNLERCMSLVGREAPDRVVCPEYTGEDEISRLGKSFSAMLAELRKKQEMERQMVAQERLAAIGRLTAGVAHEINNPLAGVLIALDTLKRTERDNDQRMMKQVELVERGLRQIQDTVSALLVECRIESRYLDPDDIDDLRILVQADTASADKRITWHNGVSEPLPLPATPVRQIILNLALNAVQAARERSAVDVAVRAKQQYLQIAVGDSGPPIPEQVIDHLFEPFESRRPGGTGLGLWVTYETIRQLGGTIEVRSDENWTEFRASLPLKSPVTVPGPEQAA